MRIESDHLFICTDPGAPEGDELVESACAWNTMPDGEEVFYISTPSAGLWSTKAKLENPARREMVVV